MPQSHRAQASWLVGVLIVVWLGVVTAGWCCIARYEFSTNEPATHGRVTQWPADCELERPNGSPKFVVFLHPKCPCSRASLFELRRILADATANNLPAPDVLVVATVPLEADADWLATHTMTQAAEINRGRIFVDRGGSVAARFGATTSGLTMYFDASGSCRYAGGITVSRGHEGHSAGGDRLAELLRGEPIAANALGEMPVFGCRLCLPTSMDAREIADVSRLKATPPKSSI
jgi:hypothetical protein